MGEIFRSCEAELLALAHRQVRSQLAAKAGAADLVQDTFLEAQQAFTTFNGESRGELMAWFRRILLRNAHNFRRRYVSSRKRDIGMEVGLDEPAIVRDPRRSIAAPYRTPCEQAILEEEKRRVRRALVQLSPGHRRVVYLRCHRQHSFAEIARHLSLSEEAARKLWSRALRALADQFPEKQ